MKLIPFGSRVVIEPPAPEKTTIEGFDLSQGSQERPEFGVVVEVGPDCKEVKTGNMVSFTRYAGAEVALGDKKVYVVKEEELAGRVEK